MGDQGIWYDEISQVYAVTNKHHQLCEVKESLCCSISKKQENLMYNQTRCLFSPPSLSFFSRTTIESLLSACHVSDSTLSSRGKIRTDMSLPSEAHDSMGFSMDISAEGLLIDWMIPGPQTSQYTEFSLFCTTWQPIVLCSFRSLILGALPSSEFFSP